MRQIYPFDYQNDRPLYKIHPAKFYLEAEVGPQHVRLLNVVSQHRCLRFDAALISIFGGIYPGLHTGYMMIEIEPEVAAAVCSEFTQTLFNRMGLQPHSRYNGFVIDHLKQQLISKIQTA